MSTTKPQSADKPSAADKGAAEDYIIKQDEVTDSFIEGRLTDAFLAGLAREREKAKFIDWEKLYKDEANELYKMAKKHDALAKENAELKAEVEANKKHIHLFEESIRHSFKEREDQLKAEVERLKDKKFEIEDAAWHRGYNASLKDSGNPNTLNYLRLKLTTESLRAMLAKLVNATEPIFCNPSQIEKHVDAAIPTFKDARELVVEDEEARKALD